MTLAIYGAGGLGREVLGLAKHVNAAEERWDKVLFVADTVSDRAVGGAEVLTPGEALGKYPEIEFVIAVGEPAARAAIAEKVSAMGGVLATLVHPDAEVDDSVQLGAGVVVNKGAKISCGVRIGSNTFFQPYALAGHDAQVGEHCVISSYVVLAGACRVGSRTYIGLSVPVKEKTVIGSDVIVAMGSAVFRDIPDDTIAAGNPARVSKNNDAHSVFK